MVLIVDFNMKEGDGQYPALLPGAQAGAVRIGERVLAADGEGLSVQAEVTEISSDHTYVMLRPVGGFQRGADAIMPSASDVFA
jgi:hypothetical protein